MISHSESYTASSTVLGQGKWQIGPDFIIGHIGNHSGGLSLQDFNFVLLWQEWWPYAGSSSRNPISQANIQYFINYRLSPTQFIGLSPNVTVNWKAPGGSQLTFPIGLGYQQITRLWKLPGSWRAEFQYAPMHPDNAGTDWNFRLQITPIIPNLVKLWMK